MPKSLLSFCSVDSAAASPQLFLPSPASLGDFIIAKFSGRCSVLTLLGFSAALDTVYYSAHFWNSFSCHSSSLISPHVLCWLGWWYVHSNIFSFLFGQVCSAWHSHVGVPQVSDSACTRRSAHLPVPSDLWMMLLACSLRQESSSVMTPPFSAPGFYAVGCGAASRGSSHLLCSSQHHLSPESF